MQRTEATGAALQQQQGALAAAAPPAEVPHQLQQDWQQHPRQHKEAVLQLPQQVDHEVHEATSRQQQALGMLQSDQYSLQQLQQQQQLHQLQSQQPNPMTQGRQLGQQQIHAAKRQLLGHVNQQVGQQVDNVDQQLLDQVDQDADRVDRSQQVVVDDRHRELYCVVKLPTHQMLEEQQQQQQGHCQQKRQRADEHAQQRTPKQQKQEPLHHQQRLQHQQLQQQAQQLQFQQQQHLRHQQQCQQHEQQQLQQELASLLTGDAAAAAHPAASIAAATSGCGGSHGGGCCPSTANTAPTVSRPNTPGTAAAAAAAAVAAAGTATPGAASAGGSIGSMGPSTAAAAVVPAGAGSGLPPVDLLQKMTARCAVYQQQLVVVSRECEQLRQAAALAYSKWQSAEGELTSMYASASAVVQRAVAAAEGRAAAAEATASSMIQAARDSQYDLRATLQVLAERLAAAQLALAAAQQGQGEANAAPMSARPPPAAAGASSAAPTAEPTSQATAAKTNAVYKASASVMSAKPISTLDTENALQDQQEEPGKLDQSAAELQFAEKQGQQHAQQQGVQQQQWIVQQQPQALSKRQHAGVDTVGTAIIAAAAGAAGDPLAVAAELQSGRNRLRQLEQQVAVIQAAVAENANPTTRQVPAPRDTNVEAPGQQVDSRQGGYSNQQQLLQQLQAKGLLESLADISSGAHNLQQLQGLLAALAMVMPDVPNVAMAQKTHTHQTASASAAATVALARVPSLADWQQPVPGSSPQPLKQAVLGQRLERRKAGQPTTQQQQQQGQQVTQLKQGTAELDRQRRMQQAQQHSGQPGQHVLDSPTLQSTLAAAADAVAVVQSTSTTSAGVLPVLEAATCSFLEQQGHADSGFAFQGFSSATQGDIRRSFAAVAAVAATDNHTVAAAAGTDGIVPARGADSNSADHHLAGGQTVARQTATSVVAGQAADGNANHVDSDIAPRQGTLRAVSALQTYDLLATGASDASPAVAAAAPAAAATDVIPAAAATGSITIGGRRVSARCAASSSRIRQHQSLQQGATSAQRQASARGLSTSQIGLLGIDSLAAPRPALHAMAAGTDGTAFSSAATTGSSEATPPIAVTSATSATSLDVHSTPAAAAADPSTSLGAAATIASKGRGLQWHKGTPASSTGADRSNGGNVRPADSVSGEWCW